MQQCTLVRMHLGAYRVYYNEGLKTDEEAKCFFAVILDVLYWSNRGQQRLVLCQVQWYSREQSHWLLSWVRTLAVLSLPTYQDISQQLTNSFRAIHPLLTSLRLPFAGTSKDTNSTQMHSPRLKIQSSNTAPSSLQSYSSTLPDQSCLEVSSWFYYVLFAYPRKQP